MVHVSHLLRAPTEGLHWTHLLDTRLGKVLYLLDVVYENEDLQAGVLGDGIYFALQHSDPGGKGHLAYYMRMSTACCVLFWLYLPTAPQKGLTCAFYNNPHNAQTVLLEGHRWGGLGA